MTRRPLAVLLLASVLGYAAGVSLGAAPETRLEERILTTLPTRSPRAMSGTAFAKATAAIDARERQRRAVEQILSGNVPSFVRHLRPVRLDGTTPSGRAHRLSVFVSPDYLAVGSDEDFLRVPLTWPSAVRVASGLGCLPPTPLVVDAIYAQADHRLIPAPLPPGPRMRSSAYYLRHRGLIEGQRAGFSPDSLLAGHKKDVVVSRRLLSAPGRIAIYGWHRSEDAPIQPLSTVHGARYADYSHGLRLVWEQAELDGTPVPLSALLEDPDLAWLISGEGPIPEVRRLMRLADDGSARR